LEILGVWNKTVISKFTISDGQVGKEMSEEHV